MASTESETNTASTAMATAPARVLTGMHDDCLDVWAEGPIGGLSGRRRAAEADAARPDVTHTERI